MLARIRSLFRLGAVVGVAGVGLSAVLVASIPQFIDIATAHSSTASLPPFEPLAQRSQVYDAAGNLLAEFVADQNRVPITLDQVSINMIKALVAVEDKNFFKHDGVDIRAIARVTLANVSAGSAAQGGSTITQQLVRNGLFDREKTASGKLKEALYALRLEKQMSKQEILERYLNTVYFGNGAYGIAVASQLYFGVEAAQLDIGQAAFLTGLIRNPSGYDPYRYPDRSRARRRQALQRLVDQNVITETEYKALDSAPIPDSPKYTLATSGRATDTYFVDQVKLELLDDTANAYGLGTTASERYSRVFRGGLKITTTLDPAKQQAALESRDGIIATVPNNDGRFTAAVASIEPQTGAIRAVIGGTGEGASKFDLATQGTRQPGSSFKPFVLVTALEAGARPDDMINGSSPCEFENPGSDPPTYRVTSTSGGTRDLSYMIKNSINCAFVRLGLVVGEDRVIATAKRMGVDTSKMQPFPSLALGTFEVSPMDMAAAYSVLANNGVRNAPYVIEKIEGPDGKVVYQHKAQPERVIAPEIAETATQMLTGVVTGGTGTRARITGREVAGKTGTSQDNADAWFVGYTPQLSTAVWMGNPQKRESMANLGGRDVVGGLYPAMIWKQYTETALDGVDAVAFARPPELQANRDAMALVLVGDKLGDDCPTAPASRSPSRSPSSGNPADRRFQPLTMVPLVYAGTTCGGFEAFAPAPVEEDPVPTAPTSEVTAPVVVTPAPPSPAPVTAPATAPRGFPSPTVTVR
ncbi:MAG: PBP1A family penicillin-binding protein [Acidimicrobiia bacterium]